MQLTGPPSLSRGYVHQPNPSKLFSKQLTLTRRGMDDLSIKRNLWHHQQTIAKIFDFDKIVSRFGVTSRR